MALGEVFSASPVLRVTPRIGTAHVWAQIARMLENTALPPSSQPCSRVRNPFKVPQPRWQGHPLPSLLKNLLWKRGEHHLERAQTHLAVYPRLAKRNKLGTRGNIVTLGYWWEKWGPQCSVPQPGGDTERGQGAAAGAHSTEGPPRSDPHTGGCSPSIPRCASPGGIPARPPSSPLLTPHPTSPYQDVISLRFPPQSWKGAPRCS